MRILKKLSPIKTITVRVTRKSEGTLTETTGNISITAPKVLSNKYIAKYTLKLIKFNTTRKIWNIASGLYDQLPFCFVSYLANEQSQNQATIDIVENIESDDKSTIQIYIHGRKEKQWTLTMNR